MNKKTKRILIVGIVVVLIVGLLGGGFCAYKLYKHEKSQSTQIQDLSNRISTLNSELALLKSEADPVTVDWSDGGYNYLAIGNSITLHDYASYWWDNDRGMASSSDDKDYVHLVEQYLQENNKDVTMHTFNFSTWETNGNDRAEFFPLLAPYLSEKLNLVTIQLGENASNFDTWESDFEELISYVKENCPNAQIIVVGDFWSNGNRDADKATAAEAQGVTYVSLDGIKDNEEYYAGLGTTVEGNDGNTYTIEHSGVASHPGDKGMAAIADRITPEIDLTK